MSMKYPPGKGKISRSLKYFTTCARWRRYVDNQHASGSFEWIGSDGGMLVCWLCHRPVAVEAPAGEASAKQSQPPETGLQ